MSQITTISTDDFDAVTLRLEQIVAIIKTLGIQFQETEEVPVSSEILAVSLLGFATFLADTRRRLCDSVQCGGASMSATVARSTSILNEPGFQESKQARAHFADSDGLLEAA